MGESPRAAFMRRALESADRARAGGAPIVSSIAASQAALESNYGASRLAFDGCNLFGVKAGQSWQGHTLSLPTTEIENGHPITVQATWRVYGSWDECFTDYGRIIASHPWYAPALEAAARNDALGFLEGLLPVFGADGSVVKMGWSTNPAYRDRVLAIATQWGLLTA
ncbi:MAG: glucosaminidase domain-containing protein [Thermoanaerobaculaceae bacterium]|jgi:flagellar protein FlgJ